MVTIKDPAEFQGVWTRLHLAKNESEWNLQAHHLLRALMSLGLQEK